MQKRGFSRFLMMFTGLVILLNIFSATYISLQLTQHFSSKEVQFEEKISAYQHDNPIQLEDIEEKTIESLDGEDEDDRFNGDFSCQSFLSSGAGIFHALSSHSDLSETFSLEGYPSLYILFENFRL